MPRPVVFFVVPLRLDVDRDELRDVPERVDPDRDVPDARERVVPDREVPDVPERDFAVPVVRLVVPVARAFDVPDRAVVDRDEVERDVVERDVVERDRDVPDREVPDRDVPVVPARDREVPDEVDRARDVPVFEPVFVPVFAPLVPVVRFRVVAPLRPVVERDELRDVPELAREPRDPDVVERDEVDRDRLPLLDGGVEAARAREIPSSLMLSLPTDSSPGTLSEISCSPTPSGWPVMSWSSK